MSETEAGAPGTTARGGGTASDTDDLPPTEDAPTTIGPKRPWRQALWTDVTGAIPDATASLVYVLAVWHTFIYGTNVWFTGWQRTLLWVMQLPIAVMFIARLLGPLRKSERLPLTPSGLAPRLGVMTVLRLGVRTVAAAAIAGLVGILALDRTGGHQRPEQYPTEAMQHGEGHEG